MNISMVNEEQGEGQHGGDVSDGAFDVASDDNVDVEIDIDRGYIDEGNVDGDNAVAAADDDDDDEDNANDDDFAVVASSSTDGVDKDDEVFVRRDLDREVTPTSATGDPSVVVVVDAVPFVPEEVNSDLVHGGGGGSTSVAVAVAVSSSGVVAPSLPPSVVVGGGDIVAATPSPSVVVDNVDNGGEGEGSENGIMGGTSLLPPCRPFPFLSVVFSLIVTASIAHRVVKKADGEEAVLPSIFLASVGTACG